MIVIAESKLPNIMEETKRAQMYRAKGYRYCYIWDNPYIKDGESVGFLLDKLKYQTIDKINNLLYYKHTLTLKLDDKVYKLSTLDEWSKTVQDPKDQIKTVTIKHPVLQAYYDNRTEYREKQQRKTLNDQYELVVSTLDNVPTEEELDIFLDRYAKLYSIYLKNATLVDKIRYYQQISYYLEHDLNLIRILRKLKY